MSLHSMFETINNYPTTGLVIHHQYGGAEREREREREGGVGGGVGRGGYKQCVTSVIIGLVCMIQSGWLISTQLIWSLLLHTRI